MFIEKFLIWETKIPSISIDRCISVSFGFPNDPIGFFTVDLTLDVDVEFWNREILGNTDDCFIVFVGGNYIDKLDQVIEKVGSIGKKLQTMARAIFINSQKGERRNIKETWPPLVSIFVNYFLIMSCHVISGLLSSFHNWYQGFLQCPVSRRIHQQCS